MKAFRLVGLLVVLAAVWSGVTRSASATPFCVFTCSGVRYSGPCFQSLRDCCNQLSGDCPDGTTFQSGNCSDGNQSC
ncbi:MAG TPA: hypothetical protein VF173_32890 [Thermoanaerobaculia bacterium]|nr:hypothetical protein [Thermoanaerobaculia bacterium]